jgi:ribosome biogenesis GTPase / thiamine phosphate phosphatase
VRAALESGSIDAARWEHYRKLQDELAAASGSLASQLAKKADARVQNKALGKRLTEKYGKR